MDVSIHRGCTGLLLCVLSLAETNYEVTNKMSPYSMIN